MISPWKRARHRLEYAVVRLLAWGIPKLSRRAAVRAGKALGALAYRLDARGRAVSLANLEAVFGDKFGPAERERIARASYQTFARTMLDLFWAQRLTPENWTKYLRLENAERFADDVRSGRGALFAFTHLGNFEWTHLAIGFAGFGGYGVQEDFKNPLLTEIFTRLRGHSGHTVVAQERSMLRFFKHLKRGGTAGPLIDLTLSPSQPSAIIDALGLKMCVTYMHAELSRRTGLPIYPLEAIPADDGTCRVIVHDPVAFPAETPPQVITQACWNVFEPIIRARPEHWMWAYKHFRYKPAGATRPYPFYANESKKFEKLRRETPGG